MDFFAALFVTYAGEKLLDRLMFSKTLPDELRQRVEIWIGVLPEKYRFHPQAMFPDFFTARAGEEEGMALTRLKTELSASRIPTVELWEETLLEHWDHRKRSLGDTAADFFKLSREEAQGYLHELAVLMQQACVEDRRLFQGEVFNRLPDRARAFETGLRDFVEAHREYCLQFPYASFYERLSGGLPHSLDQVFVPLSLETLSRGASSAEPARSGAARLAPSDLLRQLALPESQPVLILGEPGMGKSTLLRHVGLHAWYSPEKVGLSTQMIPLLLRLRWLASTDGASVETRLRNAIDVGGELILYTDLPADFLSEWPRSTGAKWLFLLDGLDEVPRSRRAGFTQWLKSFLVFVQRTGGRVILTSRPQEPAYEMAASMNPVRIAGFLGEERMQLAKRWFGPNAEDFMEAVDQLRGGAATVTPLLMSIAAAIYHHEGKLPEQRSGLYDRSVDICLSEAEAQGMGIDIEERLLKLVRSLIEFLALRSIQHERADARDQFVRWTAQYVHRTMGRSTRESTVDAGRMVETVGRRSGVLVSVRDTLTWVHPSFSEYLAACQLDRSLDPNSEESLQFLLKWSNPNWHEVILFLLSRWGERGADVAHVMQELSKTNAEIAFSLCLEGFAEIPLPSAAAKLLTDRLFTMAIQESNKELGRLRERPITVLARMARVYPYAREALRRLASSGRVDTQIRHDAVGGMLKAEDHEGFLTLLGTPWLWSAIETYWWDLVELKWVDDVNRTAIQALTLTEASPELRQAVAEVMGAALKRKVAPPFLRYGAPPPEFLEHWVHAALRLTLGSAAADIEPRIGTVETSLLVESLIADGDLPRAVVALSGSKSLKPAEREKILTVLLKVGHAKVVFDEAQAALEKAYWPTEIKQNLWLIMETVRSASSSRELRAQALEVLARQGATAELKRLGVDESLPASIHEGVLEVLSANDQISVLREIALDGHAPAWSRYSAMMLLLDRGWGPANVETLNAMLADHTLPESLRGWLDRLSQT